MVSPINITSAALIIHFSLSIIAFVAVVILRSGEPRPTSFRDVPNPPTFTLYLLTFGYALATIGLLVFSDEYASTWKPLFPEVAFGGLPWPQALTIVFVVDIIWVTIAVACTGGSSTSPFGPVYFMIPALAIFLRAPLDSIFMYLALIILTFLLNLVFGNRRGLEYGSGRRSVAYGWVSVACLLLATLAHV